MNSKQKKTFKAIFKKPVPADIKYNDVVAMMKALGADFKKDKSGSRVGFSLNGCTITIHAPHPGNELKQYAVKDIRDFLIKAGVKI